MSLGVGIAIVRVSILVVGLERASRMREQSEGVRWHSERREKLPDGKSRVTDLR